ncbi:hypothetical protein E3P96_03360 [Wallemia ichthyophaga]|nr:hypothetical protein E3P96_03360 [Wallemia ichthyophaga]
MADTEIREEFKGENQAEDAGWGLKQENNEDDDGWGFKGDDTQNGWEESKQEDNPGTQGDPGTQNPQPQSPHLPRSPPRSPSPPPRPSPPPPRRRNENPPEPNETLGVFGLSIRTREIDLEDEFNRFGRVDKVTIVYDQRSDRSRGFGFIKMASIEDADKCIQALNGVEIHGRNIRVDFSATKRPHSPTPGQYMGVKRFDDRRFDRPPPRGGGGGYRGGPPPRPPPRRGYYDRDDWRGSGSRRSPPPRRRYSRSPPPRRYRDYSPPPPRAGGYGRPRSRSPPPRGGYARRSPPPRRYSPSPMRD